MKMINQSRRFGVRKFGMIRMVEGEGGEGGGGGASDAGEGAGGAAESSGDGSGEGGAAAGGDGEGVAVDYFGSSIPEDWRGQMLTKAGYAEGDDFDKAMKQLDRVSDIGVFTKNYLSAQDKIRSGEISNGLPENPSDEQMAQYREAHGVPATSEDYQLSLDEGLVLGEADERIMGGIYEIAHGENISSEAMSKMTNAMLLGRQAEADARTSQDGMDEQTGTRQMKDAWGGDYQVNLNMVTGLMNQLPETIKDDFMSARLPDGKAIFNSPEVMVAMADWARKINPSATVVPGSANPMKDMNSKISDLEDRMGTSEWYKDKAAQKEYQDLVTARDSMASQ